MHNYYSFNLENEVSFGFVSSYEGIKVLLFKVEVYPPVALLFELIFSAKSSLSPGTSALECIDIALTSNGSKQNGFFRDFFSSISIFLEISIYNYSYSLNYS